MKYMGSKRAMLQNGLGTLLARELRTANRFIDLFAGSAAVASHVAQRSKIPVFAFDLQRYSTVLAGAVLGRQTKLNGKRLWMSWYQNAEKIAREQTWAVTTNLTRRGVAMARKHCSERDDLVITRAYGGHYFSPKQAVWIDSFLATLPKRNPHRTVALAALIQVASLCAAAPGHTAQPFQPTDTAIKFLEDAWKRDVVNTVKRVVLEIADIHAKCIGFARVADANKAAKHLRKGDLVFIDPPYSSVHYSRFYHVLETIARGEVGEVTGTGRYPAGAERPSSRYSISSKAYAALDDLLKTVASKGAKAILTFPDHYCSNGLSGGSVRKIASQHFTIKTAHVKSLFSSLGGTSDRGREGEAKRKAHRKAKELMLVLDPK
jgi:adenine-specific DNA methylase